MPVNKNALIRYQALDKCFKNKHRKYFIEDLLEACNQAIYDYTGRTNGIKKRTLFSDINFMMSENGYSAPIEKIKEGKRVYYRYADPDFSINNTPLSEEEIKSLKETLLLFSRLKGMPNLEWVEETMIRLDETLFNKAGGKQTIIGFEENPFLEGLQYFSQIFHAIKNKQALKIIYQGFKMPEAEEYIIHPYYLKQYNTRWFLFGYNEDAGRLYNVPLDRIKKIEELKHPYIENNDVDFDEYFEDVIGVTVMDDKPVEKILIKVSKDLFPYIKTKPLHGSQKIKEITDEYALIEYEVQSNYELERLLFSYADKLEVIEPKHLIDTLKEKAENLLKKYS